MNKSSLYNPLNTLSNALLIYFIFIVFIITLVPFDFQPADHIRIFWNIGLSDTITNIFLFIPIGFLFRLTHRSMPPPYALPTFFFGTLLSLTVETVQIFSPSRYTNPVDVLTNGFGAWLGAMTFNILSNKIQEKENSKIFDLELPLLGQVYLLIPLLWLNGLAQGDDPARLLLPFILGLSGVFILVMVWKNRWMRDQTFSPKKISLITVCWFMIGVTPSFFRYPIQVMGQVVLIGAFALFLPHILKKITIKERRIEQLTLKIVLPLYSFYLALVTYWWNPPELENIHKVFLGVAFNKRIEVIFLVVELIASYTLMGYMIAGLRGRKEDSQGCTFTLICFIALTISLITDFMTASLSIENINISRIIVVTAMSFYGAMIYSLQLKTIQRLRKESQKICAHDE
ncbi:MAG: VanZ family protein [Candidatus Electrothrix aestuarii]|uniref:VanZ family protein n=1 Tax=Candidatus Electrothrix aestuarii TaxID=3062594 RepID=A0AAU8LZY2_9BACT|nr:VanZ family protein [Candidatus Electrothrix aestuarii]